MSVGLESKFFRLKAFQISKIFVIVDMISGVYKNFSEKQWKLKKLYLSILRGVARKLSLRCPEILIGFYQEKHYFGESSLL